MSNTVNFTGWNKGLTSTVTTTAGYQLWSALITHATVGLAQGVQAIVGITPRTSRLHHKYDI